MARKQNRTKFIKIALIVIIIILGVAISWRLLQRSILAMSYFNVQSVVVSPASEVSSDDKNLQGNTDTIYNFVKDEVLGKNIFQLNLNSLSKDITAKFTNISNAILIRRIPNKIEVNIILRKPLARLSLPSGELYYLDRDATLVSEKLLLNKSDNLPIVKGLGNNPSRVELNKVVDFIECLRDINSAKKIELTQVNVEDNGELVFFIQQGFCVKVGSGDFKKRLQRLSLLLNEPKLDFAKVQYVDVRFKEPSVVYKNK